MRQRPPCRLRPCIIERKLGRDIRHIAAEFRARVTEAERAAWTSTGAKAGPTSRSPSPPRRRSGIASGPRPAAGMRRITRSWTPTRTKKVVTVDEAYMDVHLPTISQRLTQAGIRLELIFNRAFGGK